MEPRNEVGLGSELKPYYKHGYVVATVTRYQKEKTKCNAPKNRFTPSFFSLHYATDDETKYFYSISFKDNDFPL